MDEITERENLIRSIHRGIFVNAPLAIANALGTQDAYNNLLGSIADEILRAQSARDRVNAKTVAEIRRDQAEKDAAIALRLDADAATCRVAASLIRAQFTPSPETETGD